MPTMRVCCWRALSASASLMACIAELQLTWMACTACRQIGPSCLPRTVAASCRDSNKRWLQMGEVLFNFRHDFTLTSFEARFTHLFSTTSAELKYSNLRADLRKPGIVKRYGNTQGEVVH